MVEDENGKKDINGNTMKALKSITLFTNEELKKIHEKYQDVPEGERIALFGTNKLLQISMNKGKASELLGLHQFDIIRIEFR